jgi:membrane glycosyltransferase
VQAVPVTPSAGIRRFLILALSLATAGTATTIWADLLAQNGLTVFDSVQIALFALSYLWVSPFFWSSVIGWLRLATGGKTPGLVHPEGPGTPELEGKTPTAILIPVYNEDAPAVMGRLAAMYQALEKAGAMGHFHFHILSDSTEAESWVMEEIAWAECVRQLNGQGRIFYRHRAKNTARKAGNIAEFCTSQGGNYEHMIVLDADSLLTAEAIILLARLAKLNPTAGIIQGLPALIGARSFFARAQQFAVRLYGPLIGAGINFWHLGDGNYWGHNAIINTSAFSAHCGLPDIPGKPPFGGHILSHDFVEAALVRRGGWSVWLVSELPGCYEQMPASIIENGKRERRWVQGNLQHMKLLLAEGLHPMSRIHLLMGIVAFKVSILSLLFLLTGLAAAMNAHFVPPDFFMDYETLFPVWPVFNGDLALSLLAVTFVMLTLPKILAMLLRMGRKAPSFGGRIRLFLSIIIEHLFTMIIAPMLMLIHCGFIFDVLMRRDSGWGKQNRGDADTTWREALRIHRLHMAFGVALAVIAWFWARMLFWWLMPVATGLALSAPLSVFSSRVSWGQALRRMGLFVVPEEVHPPEEWTQAALIESELLKLMPPSGGPMGEAGLVLSDPLANALHLSLLPENATSLANPDTLATARRKLALGLQNQPIPALSAAERFAILLDKETLERLPLGIRPALP